MAAIATTDVTYSARTYKDRAHRTKTVDVTIAFGDGLLTYPATGVPLTLAGLGLTRNVDTVIVKITGTNPNGYGYEFDPTNTSLRIVAQAMRFGATAAAAAGTGALLTNANATETVLRIPTSVISTNYETGPGIEVASTHTPPATTLRCEARGW